MVDLIRDDSQFGLAFYRQIAQGTLEHTAQPLLAVGDGRHEGAVCRGVTAELVRDQCVVPGSFQEVVPLVGEAHGLRIDRTSLRSVTVAHPSFSRSA